MYHHKAMQYTSYAFTGAIIWSVYRTLSPRLIIEGVKHVSSSSLPFWISTKNQPLNLFKICFWELFIDTFVVWTHCEWIVSTEAIPLPSFLPLSPPEAIVLTPEEKTRQQTKMEVDTRQFLQYYSIPNCIPSFCSGAGPCPAPASAKTFDT